MVLIHNATGADDEDDPDNYIGMRILYSGRGTGQYAKIGSFSSYNKNCYSYKRIPNGESDGNMLQDIIEAVLNDTTRYYIEPGLIYKNPIILLQIQT